MVRQKIAFLCIGIHAAFHSCFDLSSGRCSKRGIYCTGSKKMLCHNEIWIYFYFVIYVLFYIQKHLYSSFTERISNMKPLSSFKPQAVFSDIDGTLLTSEHVVSPLTSSAIHTLTDQGVLFTISSARSPSGIRPIIKKMISIVVPLHSVVH